MKAKDELRTAASEMRFVKRTAKHTRKGQ